MSSRMVRKKPAPKGRDGLTVALELARKSPEPSTSIPGTAPQEGTPTDAMTNDQAEQAPLAEEGTRPQEAGNVTSTVVTIKEGAAKGENVAQEGHDVSTQVERAGKAGDECDEELEHSSGQRQTAKESLTGRVREPATTQEDGDSDLTDESSNESSSDEDEPELPGEKLTADAVRDQIQGLKALHSTWTDSVITFQSSRAAGTPAVTGEIRKIKRCLRKIEYSLGQKQLELEELTAEQEEEIIFCGQIVRGPSIKTEEKVKLPKFTRKHGANQTKSSKPRSTAPSATSVSRLIDDEAIECNRFEGGAPTIRRRQKPISPVNVDPEDLEEGAKERARKAKIEADSAKQPSTTVMIEDEVKKGRKRQAGKKKGRDDVDKESPFFKTKIDLRTVITDLTPAELTSLEQFEQAIPAAQFNWGVALAAPVTKFISTWRYDEQSEADKVKSKDITSILTFLKDVNNNRVMLTRIQSAPRLMQLSAEDPYFLDASFNWSLVKQSADFTWEHKNGFFWALQGMACRSSNETDWTSDKGLSKLLTSGYKTMQSMLDEALRHVSFDTKHKEHVLKYDDVEDCPKDLVSITGAVGWLYQQYLMNKINPEVKSNIKGPGLAHLQSKYLEVMMGATLVYEWDITNRTVQEMKDAGRSLKEISAIKKLQKSESCLKEIVKKHIKQDSIQVIKTGPSQPSLVDQALIKVQQGKGLKNEQQALSDIRKDALHSLSVFLLYGTAGLIHLWPVAHEQVMHDGAYIIKVASIFAERALADKVHVYGERAWNRLDNNVFKCLKDYVAPGGRFRKNILWDDMVNTFFKNLRIDKLSHMYVLDMGTEVLMPGISCGIDGSKCPHVALINLVQMKIAEPGSESIKRVFTATQEQRLKLGDGGDKMYSDMVSSKSVKRPHNDRTVLQGDRKKAKLNVDDRRKSKSVVHTNSDDEEGDKEGDGEK